MHDKDLSRAMALAARLARHLPAELQAGRLPSPRPKRRLHTRTCQAGDG